MLNATATSAAAMTATTSEIFLTVFLLRTFREVPVWPPPWPGCAARETADQRRGRSCESFALRWAHGHNTGPSSGDRLAASGSAGDAGRPARRPRRPRRGHPTEAPGQPADRHLERARIRRHHAEVVVRQGRLAEAQPRRRVRDRRGGVALRRVRDPGDAREPARAARADEPAR